MQKRSKRLCLALAVLLSVSMVLVALVPAVEAASYKKGSSGAVVTQIQTKLKSWGYYTGTVDGIYGSGTERAVTRIPAEKRPHGRRQGRRPDAGGHGAVRGRRRFQQFRRFRRRVQFAGRSARAPDLGGGPRRAVLRPGGRRRRRAQPRQAPVVPEYASPASSTRAARSRAIADGQFNQPVAESAYRAARDATQRLVDPSGGAIYYYNPSTATSSWIWSRPLITVIGKHRFCS